MSRQMQMNGGGMVYYVGRCIYLNRAKMCSNDTAYGLTINGTVRDVGWGEGVDGFSLTAPTWIAGDYLDSNGELLVPCSTDVTKLECMIYFSSANLVQHEDYSGEDFTLMWDGTGTLTLSQCSLVGGTYSQGATSGLCRVTLQSNPTQAKMFLTLTDWSKPPRHIRIIPTRFMDETVIEGVTYPGWNQGGKIDPYYLHHMKKFSYNRTLNTSLCNFSAVINYSELADENFVLWNAERRLRVNDDFQFYPAGRTQSLVSKVGQPLSITTYMSNITATPPWYNIPVAVTDACARSIFEYFRDNLDVGVIPKFEFTNEHWNSGFTQYHYCYGAGQAKVAVNTDFLATGAQPHHAWYGYRSAQLAKLCHDVFVTEGGRSRNSYKFALATHTAYASMFGPSWALFEGVKYYRTESGTSLPIGRIGGVDGLFDELAVAGYIGSICGTRRIVSITKASPGVVTYIGEGSTTGYEGGIANGMKVRLLMEDAQATNTTMTELEGVTVTVSNLTYVSGNNWSFSIGIDTTGFSTFNQNTKDAGATTLTSPVVVPKGELFDIMDASEAKFTANPAAYPTKYTYFAEQMAKSCRGEALSNYGITWDSGTVPILQTDFEFHKGEAETAAGVGALALSQYEGIGPHFISADFLLEGTGRNDSADRFNEYAVNIAYTRQFTDVLFEACKAFTDMGGIEPSLFVLDDNPNRYGAWATIRRWKTVNHDVDDGLDNPKWQMVRAVTGDVKRMRARPA